MKILLVIGSLGNGGKERQFVECLRFLKSNGVSFCVVTFCKNQHYSNTVSSLTHLFFELTKRPTRFEPFFTIWGPILTFKPDIVHTWDSLSSLYSYLPSKFCGSSFIDNSIQDAGVDKGLHYLMKRIFIQIADLSIGNSIAGLKYYKSPGRVLYNAIDPDRFYQRDRLDEFNIIKASSFSDFKDHLTFLKAARILLEQGLVDNVYLAGDGINRLKYEKVVADSFGNYASRVWFLGAVENIEDLLAKCKIGVLCSTSKFGEGVSNSLLEYMSAGLVAIGTNVGATSEIIENGENGFLIKEGEFEAIVEIVERVKSDRELFDRITKNAKITIEEKFLYSRNFKILLEIYQNYASAH